MKKYVPTTIQNSSEINRYTKYDDILPWSRIKNKPTRLFQPSLLCTLIHTFPLHVVRRQHGLHNYDITRLKCVIRDDWERVEQMKHLRLDLEAGSNVFQGFVLFSVVNETLKHNLNSCESVNDLNCVDGTINIIPFIELFI